MYWIFYNFKLTKMMCLSIKEILIFFLTALEDKVLIWREYHWNASTQGNQAQLIIPSLIYGIAYIWKKNVQCIFLF